MLGDFDYCQISLINNFKFTHRLFEICESSENIRNYGSHTLQSYTGFCLHDKVYSEKIFSEQIDEYFVGIIHLKLNNGIYTFIYGVGVDNKGNFNNFDCGSFEEKLNFKENFNRAEFEEVESNIGEKLENLSLLEKIKALVDCYGYECVFGSAYYPFQIVDEDSETKF